MADINPEQLKKFQQAAIDAAHSGGKILRKYWGKISIIKKKSSPSDLVTEADQESEQIIKDFLLKQYPDHGFQGEELGIYSIGSEEFTWVVDPLDGTTNYTHNFPMVCISIALVHNKKSIVGVIYNPFTEELYHAAQGLGAFLNNHPIQVSAVSNLTSSLLATGFAYDRRETIDNNYPEFCRLTQISQGVRRMGSAALDLAYVAAGRLDGYWERGLKSWDVAAGAILVQEAGGRVTAYDLSPLDLHAGRILATNGHIHELLSQELAKS